jgi:hypothetical protein
MTMRWMRALTQSPDGLLHSNGEVCCILGICCPPLAAKQRKTLADEMARAVGCDPDDARKMADWVLETFDLAPVGSLTDFKAAIKKAAKHATEG